MPETKMSETLAGSGGIKPLLCCLFLVIGLIVGHLIPLRQPFATDSVMKIVTQLELTSDLASEETNFIVDLRENGNCVDYESVRLRHLSAMEDIQKRNKQLRSK